MSLVVEKPGGRSLVQDGGRPGLAGLGVGPSGAFDRVAMRRANGLVGNGPDAAVVEMLAGGLAVRADSDHVVAVAGATTELSVDGETVLVGSAFPLPAGATLTLGRPTAGVRSYLAVAGGLDVEPVLGSRSTDTLSGIGPAPLGPGDVLPVGRAEGAAEPDEGPPLDVTTYDVVLGPRDDWFTDAAVDLFLATDWTLSPRCDRVGLRLDGPALERAITDELPSEPCVRGSIQVTAEGLPIVLGPDHPVTGGYPVIAVVVDAHTDRLAQARPGDVVRFSRVAAST